MLETSLDIGPSSAPTGYYTGLMTPDPLAPQAFLSADELRAQTFVRHVEIHDTLDSTNNRALELARDPNVELPALVVARIQTAGRGRGTNKWWSADGALTFSLLIDPAAHGIAVANWPQLSLTTAVAVCDALQFHLTPQQAGARAPLRSDGRPPTGSRIGIKWPNDVLINDRKVAGILLESPGGTAPAKNRLILGVGVNVNNSWRSVPPQAGTEGTALCDVTNQKLELKSLLIEVVQRTAIRLGQLKSSADQLVRDWQLLDLLAGHEIRNDLDGRQTVGSCTGIASDAALLIHTPAGAQRIYSGTVRLA